VKATHELDFATFEAKRDTYLRTLPNKPYCTNRLGSRLHITNRQRAAGYAMIQHNSPMVWRWLVFDVDGDDAHSRAEDRGCPPPTFIALNRDNGHGHLAYMLETPVSAFATSSRKAMKFCEDVERGITHRLGADCAYPSFLSKNPLYSLWETDWQAVNPYRLDTLNDYLDKSDKRKALTREPSAIGRNVTMFDTVRAVAYKHCLKFKKAGRSFSEFATMLRDVAGSVNSTFPIPLFLAEINGIVRSVAKWVWDMFCMERFSAIQRERVSKRWAKKSTLTSTKPWEANNVSRATWYRKQALNPSNLLIS
jgi:hypothetical protein